MCLEKKKSTFLALTKMMEYIITEQQQYSGQKQTNKQHKNPGKKKVKRKNDFFLFNFESALTLARARELRIILFYSI